MAVRDYTGTQTLQSPSHDKRGYRHVEWDADGATYKGRVVPGAPDGSIYRGYELPDGRLEGACFAPSAARIAQLAAERAADDAAANARQQFLDRCETLYQKAKAHAETPGSNPALTVREMNEAFARLFMLARQILELRP